MASALKTYVEKYLLNPAASFNVDDDGNQETKAQVVDTLAENEQADSSQRVSKLRARSAALQAEKDPRYKGKKVLRKDLKKENKIEFDPELTKYFAIEENEGESEQDSGDDEENENGYEHNGEDDDEEEEEEDDENNVESEDEIAFERFSLKQKKVKAVTEDDEESSESKQDNEDTIQKIHQQLYNEPKGVMFNDDGDFSKFADDFENEDEEEDDDDTDDDNEDDEGEEEEFSQEDSLKKFSSGDQSEEVKKGQAVQSQLAIYDSLFEGRIGLQKVVIGSNQLPQFDTYKLFVRENDPHYNKNLVTAKKATKKLLDSLLHIQEMLLKQNPETSHILTGKKPKRMGTESDEEITSSEEEEKKEEEEISVISQGTKRKIKFEEYEEKLKKRHAAMVPFRDQTIDKWYEKTKLLSTRSAREKFSGFEVSVLQQLNNILANKQQLIHRTQLTGATRGTAYHILGRSDETGELDKEEHNPEIFDDTDFYTRSLEEMLKVKVSLTNNMTDVSRKWIEIQKLRRKAKRSVDTKASKGRKVRYEVISKLQQYLAPCNSAQMDDAAINTLFASLFGKSVQEMKTGSL